VASNSPLNADAEPRIKKVSGEHADNALERQKATYPFFWAGYLLVDSGCPLPQPEAKPAK
jgi:hypothetical protein